QLRQVEGRRGGGALGRCRALHHQLRRRRGRLLGRRRLGAAALTRRDFLASLDPDELDASIVGSRVDLVLRRRGQVMHHPEQRSGYPDRKGERQDAPHPQPASSAAIATFSTPASLIWSMTSTSTPVFDDLSARITTVPSGFSARSRSTFARTARRSTTRLSIQTSPFGRIAIMMLPRSCVSA